MEQKIVSRTEIFDQKNDASDNEHVETFVPEFEFVEVNNVSQEEKNDSIEREDIVGQPEEEEAFEFFPLFATEELTKVNLEEPEVEEIEIIRERPKDYYFASYTKSQKEQFKDAGITYDQVIQLGQSPYKRYKETKLDLWEHNAKINKELNKERILKKRKPGKNQRLARKQAKLHIQQREDQRKDLKKKFRRRGGKKNKKKEKLNPLLHAGAVDQPVTV